MAAHSPEDARDEAEDERLRPPAGERLELRDPSETVITETRDHCATAPQHGQVHPPVRIPRLRQPHAVLELDVQCGRIAKLEAVAEEPEVTLERHPWIAGGVREVHQ